MFSFLLVARFAVHMVLLVKSKVCTFKRWITTISPDLWDCMFKRCITVPSNVSGSFICSPSLR